MKRTTRTVAAAVAGVLAAVIVVVTPSPAAAAKPSPPASCALAPVAGGYELTWTAPANTGGKPILDYKIREKTYDNPVVTVSATARSDVWTAAIRTEPATLTVRARNADGVGDVCTAVTSTPPPANTPPVADAGLEPSGEVGQPITLDGSASDAEDPPSSLTISWFAAVRPSSTAVATCTAGCSTPDPTFTFNEAGTYHLHISVYDSGWLNAQDGVDVTVSNAPPPVNQAPTVAAGDDQTLELPATATLDGTVSDDGLPAGSTLSSTWSEFSGPGTVTLGDPGDVDTTATFSEAGTYVLHLTATDGDLSTTDDVTVTVTDPPPPPPASSLPCSSGSFYKDDVTDNTVSASLTASFHTFMATARPGETQHQVPYPRLNLNDLWSGVNHVSQPTDPVYKLTSNTGGTSSPKLDILRTQGFRVDPAVLALMPTGDQDRLLVVYDNTWPEGIVAQFADAEVGANNTLTASNASIMYWDSNCLDYRNPQSDDLRNFTSRGRITPAMQIPADWLQAAIDDGRGLGYVLHWFFVENDSTAGFVHPMIADESGGDGWGPEGVRWRVKPSVDLTARGLTPGCLAIARTMQESGAYLGDNSGSVTQIKLGHPDQYPASMGLSTNCFSGKLAFADFEVVTPGQQ
jgi:hypothetical protein